MTDIQTPPAHVPSVELARAGAWLRGNAVVIGSLALIAVSLWWKAILLAHSFFRFDDFIYLDRAAHSGFTWTYLMWVDAGHLTPLGYAIAWFLVKVSPADWALTSAATLVLLAITCLALLRMLRTFFGDHPGILVLRRGLRAQPAGAIRPVLVDCDARVAAAPGRHVLCHHRPRAVPADRPAKARPGGLALWLFVAMASSLRGAAVPLLLLALTSGFFVEGSWLRATLIALRERWRPGCCTWSSPAPTWSCTCGSWRRPALQPGRPGSFSGVFQFRAHAAEGQLRAWQPRRALAMAGSRGLRGGEPADGPRRGIVGDRRRNRPGQHVLPPEGLAGMGNSGRVAGGRGHGARRARAGLICPRRTARSRDEVRLGCDRDPRALPGPGVPAAGRRGPAGRPRAAAHPRAGVSPAAAHRGSLRADCDGDRLGLVVLQLPSRPWGGGGPFLRRDRAHRASRGAQRHRHRGRSHSR